MMIVKKTNKMLETNIARSTFLSTFTTPTRNQNHKMDKKFKKEPKGEVYLDAIQAICDHRAKQTSMENHEPGIFIEIKNFQLDSHVATLHMLKHYQTKDKDNENKHNSFGIAYYSSLQHCSISENVIAVLRECFAPEEQEWLDNCCHDKDIECLCLVHRHKLFDETQQVMMEIETILSVITFKILTNDCGTFIMHRGTIQNVMMNELVPHDPAHELAQHNVTNHGYGYLLMEITKLLSFNVTKINKIYLACNEESYNYYIQLGFTRLNSWTNTPNSVRECAKLEGCKENYLVPMLLIKDYMNDLGCNHIKVVNNYQALQIRWNTFGINGLFEEMDWNKSTYLVEFQEYLKNDIINTKLNEKKVILMTNDLLENGLDHNLWEKYISCQYWNATFDFYRVLQLIKEQTRKTVNRSIDNLYQCEMFLLSKVYCVPIGGYSDRKFKLYCNQCQQYINTEPLHSIEMLKYAGCLIQSHYYGTFDCNDNTLSFSDIKQNALFPMETVAMNHCKSIGNKLFTRSLLTKIMEDNRFPKNELEKISLRFYKLFHNILQQMLNEEHVKLVQKDTLKRLKEKFHYIESCIRQTNPTFRNPYVNIIGESEITKPTSRARRSTTKQSSTNSLENNDSISGINIGIAAQFNQFGSYSLTDNKNKSGIIKQDQQYHFSHIEKFVFHDRTRSQVIHACSNKYENHQVSHYVGYAQVGDSSKKREYSFIPNMNLTGTIDRRKEGCINEKFMKSLKNNEKTPLPQESRGIMKKAVIVERFKRVRYASTKVMVRTITKFALDIFLGEHGNVPEYVVDLNQFSHMFQRSNPEFFKKVLDVRNININVYVDSNDDGSIQDNYLTTFYGDNSSDNESEDIEIVDVKQPERKNRSNKKRKKKIM